MNFLQVLATCIKNFKNNYKFPVELMLNNDVYKRDGVVLYAIYGTRDQVLYGMNYSCYNNPLFISKWSMYRVENAVRSWLRNETGLRGLTLKQFNYRVFRQIWSPLQKNFVQVIVNPQLYERDCESLCKYKK